MFIFLSLIIVAFGQSSFLPFLGICSSAFGFALFWHAVKNTKNRFWAFVGWYVIVQGIQVSWLTSTKYMGIPIVIVYVGLVFVLALLFGCLSFLFKRAITLKSCFAIAGSAVILESLRNFIFTGFNWNPIGLSLASSSYAIGFASLFGVYGLSFWVIFVNAFALYARNSWKKGSVWAMLAVTPYLYGAIQKQFVQKYVHPEKMLNVALVQTGITPEQKDRLKGFFGEYIPPIIQWERICEALAGAQDLDLIVLPEAAVAHHANREVYPIEIVEAIWMHYFGSSRDLPRAPKISNQCIAQALANHFNAKVIAGFTDVQENCSTNSAFCFHPRNSCERYDKQILVPMGEYVPFAGNAWVANFLSEQFDIGDAFFSGNESKVFASEFGISICVEETYGQLIRNLRQKGAKVFVNVTNDVWFPGEHLAIQHFQHGQIRSAENGVCTLRACNTGVTAAIDCCGQIIQALPISEEKIDVLYVKLPVKSFKTLYSLIGDTPFLILCAGLAILGVRNRKVV